MNPAKDYFQLLGITAAANTQEVKKAFRKLALLYHPDKNPGQSLAAEQFAGIQEAYRVLSNPTLRARYQYARHLLHPQTQNKPLAATAEDVWEMSKKLQSEIRLQDPFRINRDLLFFQLMDLLSDHNLMLLQQKNDPVLITGFFRSATGASRNLTFAQAKNLSERLEFLTNQNPNVAAELTQFMNERKRAHYWSRYKTVIALVITLLFCLALYLSAGK